MTHDRFYRPILSAINLAVELGSNFAKKIGKFCCGVMLAADYQHIARLAFKAVTLSVNPLKCSGVR